MDQSQAEPATDSPSLYSSAFAQVIFVNVEKSYMMDTPVKCDYILTPLINANNRDWIGIFKVGWSTARDYHTFVWSPLPKADSHGDQRQQQVTFEAYYLPKDDNDFYQFCYVTNKGEIRGASTPIGFRQPGPITADISENQEMLVITTQEQIEEVEKEKAALENNNTKLTEENTVLKEKIKAFEKQVEQAKEAYSSALEKAEDNLKSMKKQMLDQKEKNEVETKMLCEKADQLEKQLTQKKEECLTTQKANQELQEKLESAQTTTKHCKQMYEKAMEELKQVKQETEALKAEIAANKTELDSVANMKSQAESQHAFALSELEVAQHDLDILRKENQELTKHQLVHFTEEASIPATGKVPGLCKTEYENARKKCKTTDSDQEQLASLRQILRLTEEELQVAKRKEEQTAAKLQATEAARESSAAELSIARQNIQYWKNKFEKIQQNLSNNEVGTEEGNSTNHPLQKEIANLKSKLLTGKSCYVQKYKECQKLHKQIDRLKALLNEKKRPSIHQEIRYKLQSPIKELVDDTDELETAKAAGSGGVNVQQAGTQLAEVQTGIRAKAAEAMIRFTEMEEDLQLKKNIVEIRTMEVSGLSNEIERLTNKIDELKANSTPQGGIFHLEHHNPYGASVPITHPGHSGLHYGNPYAERDMPTGYTIAAKDKEGVADKDDLNSRLCPVCQFPFPDDIEDCKFEEHVQSHFQLDCPVCHKSFTESQQIEFSTHVDDHFQEAN